MLLKRPRRQTEREKEPEVVVGRQKVPSGMGSHLEWVDEEW
jgi:hypothetical protein